MKIVINAAIKGLLAGIFLSMAGYVLIVLGVVAFVNRHHPRGVAAYVLAILPALPIVSVLAIVGLFLKREKDEFLRWVTIKALLWSTGAVLAGVTVMGFLHAIAHVPELPGYFICVVYWTVFGMMEGLLLPRRVGSPDE